MAQFQWGSAGGGLFNNILGWLGGAVPGASDTAILGALGASYTVTSQAGLLGLPLGGTQAVGAIQTAAGSTLQVLGGIDLVGLLGGTTTFSAANGTGGGANLGTVFVQNSQAVVPILGTLLGGSANFQIGGTFNNVGSIVLAGLPPATGLLPANQMTMLTATGPTFLTGGGHVSLSNQVLNLITGTAGAVLTNVNNTIAGSGSILGLGLINQVAGAIAADQAIPLIINAFGKTVNQGLLEATHGGTLILKGNIDNTGGKILVQAGRVILGGVTITNGALVAGVSGGFIALQAANTLIGGGLNGIDISGPLALYSNATLTIEGALNNFGKLLIKAGKGKGTTDLIVGAPGVILSGGGQILLTSLSSVITSATTAATLTNVDNLITGSGLLGKGFLTLINGVKGTIRGAGPLGLVIDTGINTIENAGLIAAIKGGQTLIESVIDNTGSLASQGGQLTVLSAVTGSGEGIVKGGTLAFASSFAQNVAFQGSGVLQLAQSQNFTGQVTGFTRSGSTAFDLRDIGFASPSEATYSGTASGGTLTVSDGTHTAQIKLVGDYLGSTFVASGDNHGGTIVVDHAAPPTGAPAHRFVAAAAALGAGAAGSASAAHEIRPGGAWMLARPAVMTA